MILSGCWGERQSLDLADKVLDNLEMVFIDLIFLGIEIGKGHPHGFFGIVIAANCGKLSGFELDKVGMGNGSTS